MPTIGQPEFFFRAFERDFCAIGLDRADFVRSGLPRERDVLFDVGFAAMAFGMFNGSASIRQASIAGSAETRWIGSSECRDSRRGQGLALQWGRREDMNEHGIRMPDRSRGSSSGVNVLLRVSIITPFVLG